MKEARLRRQKLKPIVVCGSNVEIDHLRTVRELYRGWARFPADIERLAATYWG